MASVNWYREFGETLRKEKNKDFFRGYIKGILDDWFNSFGLSRKQADIMAELFLERCDLTD